MKTPIKPKAPAKPTKPNTHHSRQVGINEWLGYEGKYTLEEMLAKLPKGIKSTDLIFTVEYLIVGSDYCGDHDYEERLNCVFTIQEENKNYAIDVKRHEKALVKHEKQMKEYGDSLVKYEGEMKIYRAWEQEEKAKQDVKELEKLKKKIKELEKKVAV
jgi:hypothetical protein